MSDFQKIPLVGRAEQHSAKMAIITSEEKFTYKNLLVASENAASCLLSDQDDLREQRIAYLIPSGFHHVAVQWGIWRAGGVAVPLSNLYTIPELEYLIADSDASIVIAPPNVKEKVSPIVKTQKRRLLITNKVFTFKPRQLPSIDPERRAMILYTSGTTDKPKGVVTTHKNLEAQIISLISAWEWTSEDHILNALPLNHIHGIINVLSCALWAGATCSIIPKFDAEQVWEHIIEANLTLFMAVPTIYAKLIAFWKRASFQQKKTMSSSCSRMRLMVSGSAALPVSILKEWREISGHVLLERYGMTETGMILSNPLHELRMPGYVGKPLPFIEVRIVDEKNKPAKPGTPGEIQVRGPGIFREYWRNAVATENAFVDGWFCTGDIAVNESESYRILGRSSVDIIKSGGNKISALEIENVIQNHHAIKECAVVGFDDPEWGELVSVALVLEKQSQLTLASFRKWAKRYLARYKIPKRIIIIPDLPRNTLGKVSKRQVVQLFKLKNGGKAL